MSSSVLNRSILKQMRQQDFPWLLTYSCSYLEIPVNHFLYVIYTDKFAFLLAVCLNRAYLS